MAQELSMTPVRQELSLDDRLRIAVRAGRRYGKQSHYRQWLLDALVSGVEDLHVRLRRLSTQY